MEAELFACWVGNNDVCVFSLSCSSDLKAPSLTATGTGLCRLSECELKWGETGPCRMEVWPAAYSSDSTFSSRRFPKKRLHTAVALLQHTPLHTPSWFGVSSVCLPELRRAEMSVPELSCSSLCLLMPREFQYGSHFKIISYLYPT